MSNRHYALTLSLLLLIFCHDKVVSFIGPPLPHRLFSTFFPHYNSIDNNDNNNNLLPTIKSKNTVNRWTVHEDELLRKGIEAIGCGHWKSIAENFVPSRTAKQCRSRWIYTLSPDIRIGPWTAQEDSRLRELVDQYGEGKWKAISDKMDGRTSIICRFRWINVLKPSLKRGNWTTEEDDLLRQYYQAESKTRWKDLTTILPHRSAIDIRDRYSTLFKTGRKRLDRYWKANEDEMLREAVRRNGERDWQRTSREIPGSTVKQCMHRWRLLEKASNESHSWTPEEDELLLNAVNTYGSDKWTKVAAGVGGRTARECRKRWTSVLLPRMNESPWTADEDRILLSMRSKRDSSWLDLVSALPTRNKDAVYARCQELNVPIHKWQPWTDEESKLLKDLTLHYEGRKNWLEISSYFPGRTARQCYNHYRHQITTNVK
eukprot:gene1226-1334_t